MGKFASKRMALLYVSKMNSDTLQAYLKEIDRSWDDFCPASGMHALSPNTPFLLDRFLELSDDALEQYGVGVGNIMTVRKIPQGSICRYTAVPLATVDEDEFWSLLTNR